VVRPLVVVEAKVALQPGVELPELREVAPAELDPPVVVEDRLLQALDEAVGEGVARLRSGVPDVEIPAGLVEGALELAASVGENPADFTAGLAEVLSLLAGLIPPVSHDLDPSPESRRFR